MLPVLAVAWVKVIAPAVLLATYLLTSASVSLFQAATKFAATVVTVAEAPLRSPETAA